MAGILARWETIKKDKYGKHCNNQRNMFSLFFLSVNGLLVRKPLVVLAQFSRNMAKKRNKPLSHIRGLINGQIAIAVARSYLHMIRGAQLPSPLRDRDTECDP